MQRFASAMQYIHDRLTNFQGMFWQSFFFLAASRDIPCIRIGEFISISEVTDQPAILKNQIHRLHLHVVHKVRHVTLRFKAVGGVLVGILKLLKAFGTHVVRSEMRIQGSLNECTDIDQGIVSHVVFGQ